MLKFPIIKFSIVFIVGILIAIYFKLNSNTFIWAFSFLIVIIFFLEFYLKPSFKWKALLVETVLLNTVFLSGIVITIVNTDSNKLNHFSKIVSSREKDFYKTSIKLSSSIKINENSVKFVGELKEIQYSNSTSIVSGKTIVYLDKDSLSKSLLPGDLISVKSVIDLVKPNKNPGQFNYKKYLENKQIEYVIYAHGNWQYIHSNINLFRIATICRNYCINVFKSSGLKGDYLAIASALTFGYKDDLSNNVKSKFSSTGAMHVLAVSGLHIGIIYFILISFFSLLPIDEKYNLVKYIIILFVLWSYAFISGLSPSVIRACTMLSFFIVAETFNKSANVYNILLSSAILLLIIKPFLIIDISFQLSYFAVFGILFLHPKIYNLISFRFWFLNKIWSLTAVSISAQLATFPLGLYYFHQFPNYFILTNLIVIPMAFAVLILGLIIISLSFFSPIIIFLGTINSYLLKSFYFAVNFIDNIPGSSINGFSISIFETVLIYISFFLISIFMIAKRTQFLFCSFLCIGLLFYLDYKEDLSLDKQKKIIVYDIKNHFAMDLIHGKNHYLICDNYLVNHKEKMMFYLQNNWFDLDLNDAVYVDQNIFLSKSIKWANKKIAFIDENWNDTSRVDIAIPCNNKKISNNINSDVIIFSSNVSNFDCYFLKSLKNKSLFYDVSKSGAYIHNI